MSKSDLITSEQIERDLISSTVEKHLLCKGRSMHEQIIKELVLDGHILDDCYAHPEILVNIVRNHFGNEGNAVILSIEKELRKSSPTRVITEFVDTLRSSFGSYEGCYNI